MKNTNALQIAVIFCVIIIIGLIVGLVVVNQGSAEREAARTTAESNANKAQQEMQAAKAEALQLRTQIGHKDDLDMTEIEKMFDADMNRATKTDDNPTRNYRDALRKLQSELASKNEELARAVEENQRIEAELLSRTAQYEEVKASIEASRDQALNDFLAEKEALDKVSEQERQAVAQQTQAKEQIQADAEAKIKAAQNQTEAALRMEQKVTSINKGLTNMLSDLRREVFDQPDGKILSVNQQDGTVIVNVGKGDGLRTRMTFSVYRPTITGISFGADHEESDANICDVCKRVAAHTATKASIEIIELMADPHKARARVLDDMLTDPIVPGDVIHTPIWKPGQIQRFALAAGMRVPGLGRRDGRSATASDLDRIVQLIKDNGGIVDAYISEGDEDHQRGDIVGQITQDTTFVVLGSVTDEDNQDQATMTAQKQMLDEAETLAVKQISLSQLLSMMGWKNVTPIRGFGNSLMDTDVEMKAEWRPISTGLVTPLYKPQNMEARLSPEDYPQPRSTGTTSSLYQGKAISGRSTGTVSDLFRPRQPGVTSSGEN